MKGKGKGKILQVTAADITVEKLLLPLIDRLIEAGFSVQAVCSDGPYLRSLREAGYAVTPIEIRRRIAPLSNLKSLWALYRFIRRERFEIVHTHTPVASVVGRIAAWLARVPIIIYTAHGFYFHDRMSRWERRLFIWIERIIGRAFTDVILTQSREDHDTALKEGIATDGRVVWIGNGVNVDRLSPRRSPKHHVRQSLGLGTADKTIAFAGRVVREKGIEELVRAMEKVVRAVPEAKLLVVGETLTSDRERGVETQLRQTIQRSGLDGKIRFTGFREDIPEILSAVDLFVLPSHREGMPRTILEAMASGLPVVATDIRGCREEVVDGITGLLVPVGDPNALAGAIIRILSDESLACRMGEAGRKRVEAEFDERQVLERQVEVYRQLCETASTGR
ncbi:MAG: GT4 family glycosyltransferase PelF [Candidatus Bipolaricaulia bacterium]